MAYWFHQWVDISYDETLRRILNEQAPNMLHMFGKLRHLWRHAMADHSSLGELRTTTSRLSYENSSR
jgi:hypothetical protein